MEEANELVAEHAFELVVEGFRRKFKVKVSA